MDFFMNYKIMIPLLVACLVVVIIDIVYCERYRRWERRYKAFMKKFGLKNSRELENVKRKYGVQTFDELYDIVEKHGIQTLVELDESLYYAHRGEWALYEMAILKWCKGKGMVIDENAVDETEKNILK